MSYDLHTTRASKMHRFNDLGDSSHCRSAVIKIIIAQRLLYDFAARQPNRWSAERLNYSLDECEFSKF